MSKFYPRAIIKQHLINLSIFIDNLYTKKKHSFVVGVWLLHNIREKYSRENIYGSVW